MKEVDILAEIRVYRAARAAKFNYDIEAMFRDVRSRQGRDGRVVLPAPPKPEPEPEPDPVAGGVPPPAAKAG